MYVAVLDKYDLLSENLTTADNQQERLIVMEYDQKRFIFVGKGCKEGSATSAVSEKRVVEDRTLEDELRRYVEDLRELDKKVSKLNQTAPFEDSW